MKSEKGKVKRGEREEGGGAGGKTALQRETAGEEYGKGFAVSNLQYMRQFYLAFPIHHTPCGGLSWSHRRRLLAAPGTEGPTPLPFS